MNLAGSTAVEMFAGIGGFRLAAGAMARRRVNHAWSSSDAVGHLTLHHQNGTGDESRAASGKELKQNIRGDVVRQVPDYIGGLTHR